MESRCILLKDRGDSSADLYEEAIARAGFSTSYVPILNFSRENADQLAEFAASGGDGCSGLVLSSQQAANALVEVLASGHACSATIVAITRLPVYVVGHKSAEALSRIGFSTSCAVNAEALVPILESVAAARADEGAPGKPLWFLVGDKRLDTIPLALQRLGMPFRELRVYRTDAAPASMVAAGARAALSLARLPPLPLPDYCDAAFGAEDSLSRIQLGHKQAEASSAGAGCDVGTGRAEPLLGGPAADAAALAAIVVFSPSGIDALLGRDDDAAAASADSAGSAPSAAEAAGRAAVSSSAVESDRRFLRAIFENARATSVRAGCGDSSATASSAASPPPPPASSAHDTELLSRWRVRLVAIGKTTAAALAARGFPPAAVCPTPDAAGVEAALRTLT